jgi:hypothetical protein
MRNESVHEQEEARHALVLRNDPAKALALAVDNWRVQREPRDARIFLEAAQAAKQPEAAKSVIGWVESSGIEDSALRELARQLDPQSSSSGKGERK